jgi:hypothetical protein
MNVSPANPEPDASPGSAPRPPKSASGGLRAWLANQPWTTFVLPLAVFTLVGSLEPTAEKPANLFGLATIPYSAYPVVYTLKIALVMVAMALVWPGYRQFPLRVSPLAPLVGAIGVVLWIGICKLELESKLLAPLGFEALFDAGARSGFNPFDRWPDNPVWVYGFLAVRFWGLAAIVPLAEEFFLRGFAMRFVVDAEWWKVPFGRLTPAAAIVGTALPMAMHPGEIFAAAAWFTLITWLMFKTRNIWDCVVAHSVTNLLLGLWVVASGDWYFW